MIQTALSLICRWQRGKNSWSCDKWHSTVESRVESLGCILKTIERKAPSEEILVVLGKWNESPGIRKRLKYLETLLVFAESEPMPESVLSAGRWISAYSTPLTPSTAPGSHRSTTKSVFCCHRYRYNWCHQSIEFSEICTVAVAVTMKNYHNLFRPSEWNPHCYRDPARCLTQSFIFPILGTCRFHYVRSTSS